MERKFNEIIDFEKIAILLLKNDLSALNNLPAMGIEVSDDFKQGVVELNNTDNLVEVIEELGKLFDTLASDKQYDLAIIIQQFMQRYGFFAAANGDYKNYTEDFGANLIKEDAGMTFAAVFSPFFGAQLDFYLSKYLETINSYDLVEWNQNLYDELKIMVEQALVQPEFTDKLTAAEQLTMFLQNMDNLYDQIGLQNNDAEKQAFLVQTNELKIVLQSIDILIERVLVQLVNAAKGLN